MSRRQDAKDGDLNRVLNQALIESIGTMQEDQKTITKTLHQLSKDQAVTNEKILNHIEKIDDKFKSVDNRLNNIPADMIHKVSVLWAVGKSILYLVGASSLGGVGWLIAKVIGIS